MFWRRNKSPEIDELELPPMELLEQWVVNVITELQLKKGTYTILPAYNGILLYIRDQGISWLPYAEIRKFSTTVDKTKLVESSILLGGVAIAIGTSVPAFSVLFLPNLIKGWYKSIMHAAPKKPVTYLQSMIESVIVEEKAFKSSWFKKLDRSNIPLKKEDEALALEDEIDMLDDEIDRALDQPEPKIRWPWKKEKDIDEQIDLHLQSFTTKPSSSGIDTIENIMTYTINVKRKLFAEPDPENKFITFVKNLGSIVSGKEQHKYPILPHSDTLKFLEILKSNGISIEIVKVQVSKKEESRIKMPSDGIVI